jgi:hypothetical protein
VKGPLNTQGGFQEVDVNDQMMQRSFEGIYKYEGLVASSEIRLNSNRVSDNVRGT